jgi:hypothetical protein
MVQSMRLGAARLMLAAIARRQGRCAEAMTDTDLARAAIETGETECCTACSRTWKCRPPHGSARG